MGSFHELKANAFAHADTPSSRFGWQVEIAVRRNTQAKEAARHPKKTQPATDAPVPPEIVLHAMQGGFHLPEQATPLLPRIPRAPDPDTFDYGSGRREAANRRKKMADHRDRGDRSSQGQGRIGR